MDTKKKIIQENQEKIYLLKKSPQTIPMSLCGDYSCLLMSYYSSQNPCNISVLAIGIFFLLATISPIGGMFLYGVNLLERI
jgi:hypothetical protein